ncbi:lipocalin family protein [Primorskyibacter sp. S87]|uniref:lipocalin family protein n=1 Tax=Primorskyibacter sp. S87 TaxID=3415126 RepID=UPI003C7AE4AE
MSRAGLAATLFGMLLAFPAAAELYRDRSVPMVSVESLDLSRYLGRWFEIARFPNRFEKNCVGVTADYGMREDGKVSVVNTCRQGTLDGPVKAAEGRATVKAPGQLSVTFVPWLPFARGDYWVLYVDPDYSLAVVGAPKGTTGWILARSPQISQADRDRAEAVLRSNGYDTDKLIEVTQPLR